MQTARLRIGCVLMGLVMGLPVPSWPGPSVQSAGPLVPVGVRYRAAPDPAERHRDLLDMQRLRFTIVELDDERVPPGRELAWLHRMLAGAASERVSPDGVPVVPVDDRTTGAEVTQRAWSALAQGSRGIVFDDWAALRRNPDASRASAEFAGHMSRNAALYAPLRPRGPAVPPGVTMAGGYGDIDVAFLESSEALVMIALNSHRAERREAILTFSPETPEAIWQNMLTGAAVNFVTGPSGPTYAAALEPSGVLVLMIRKTWR